MHFIWHLCLNLIACQSITVFGLNVSVFYKATSFKIESMESIPKWSTIIKSTITHSLLMKMPNMKNLKGPMVFNGPINKIILSN